jgi:hypothetical protein
MNLIPYEVYTLNTRLTPDQVSQRLKVSTTPKTLFYFGSFDTNTRATHPFTGSIATNRFEITLNPRRVISFGGLDFPAYTFNSFRPTLRGTIEGDFSGTVIRIRARARTFSYLL